MTCDSHYIYAIVLALATLGDTTKIGHVYLYRTTQGGQGK
jgi:hypothetical protein